MLEKISESLWYTIQFDVFSDVDKKATRLVFVQYIFQEDVHEDMLYALLLPTNTTAAELFKSLNDSISGELKEVSSECESIHCVIHEEMLNHIKVYAHNSCLLMQLCEEMNSEYTHLLLYKEVRWLSKGRLLARVSEL